MKYFLDDRSIDINRDYIPGRNALSDSYIYLVRPAKMAKILNITKTPTFTPKQASISEKSIEKTFGRHEDHIEVHIYDLRNNLLHSEPYFKDFYVEKGETPPSTPLIFDQLDKIK